MKRLFANRFMVMALGGIVVGLSVFAYQASADTILPNTVTICVKSNGFVYVIGQGFKAKDCKAKDKLITINSEGVPGPKGDSGIQGPKGDRGETGSQGVQGLVGPQGEKGDKGDTGLVGAQGIQGVQGDVGSAGLQGEKGDKGDIGLQGPKGDSATSLSSSLMPRVKNPELCVGYGGGVTFKWILYNDFGDIPTKLNQTQNNPVNGDNNSSGISWGDATLTLSNSYVKTDTANGHDYQIYFQQLTGGVNPTENNIVTFSGYVYWNGFTIPMNISARWPNTAIYSSGCYNASIDN